jgi:hypothetical protein
MPFDNGWLVIVHPDKEQCDAHTMTFCSWHCLADYAIARALIGDDTDGSGP